jgi:hypothetical protein
MWHLLGTAAVVRGKTDGRHLLRTRPKSNGCYSQEKCGRHSQNICLSTTKDGLFAFICAKLLTSTAHFLRGFEYDGSACQAPARQCYHASPQSYLAAMTQVLERSQL